MNRTTLFALAAVAILAAGFGYFAHAVNATPSHQPSSMTSQTQSIAIATRAFLGTLSPEERAQVQFPFIAQKNATGAKFARTEGPGAPGGGGPNGSPPMHAPMHEQPQDPADSGPGGAPGKGPGTGPIGGFPGFIGEQYGDAVWSNFPVGDVPRPGVRFGGLSAVQRDALTHMLQVALSAKGYQKVLDIMGSDQALHESGTPYCSGIACYTVGIFGEPSPTKPWMLEFGGHHLGLNLTMVGERGVITPTLTGAMPAVYTSNGKTVRALAAENDKAFALLEALDDNQKKQAILNYGVPDLVLGPGQAGLTIQPEGLKGSAMTGKQRAMLLDVIAEWAEIVNDSYAKPRMAEIKAGLDDTWFAWSGSTTHEPGKNGSAYYRIQGPKLIIEFSPQGTNGDLTMHVHTVYRDPTDDYGVQFNGAK